MKKREGQTPVQRLEIEEKLLGASYVQLVKRATIITVIINDNYLGVKR